MGLIQPQVFEVGGAYGDNKQNEPWPEIHQNKEDVVQSNPGKPVKTPSYTSTSFNAGHR